MKRRNHKNKLSLSSHHYQVIDDLGIDSWYLKSIDSMSMDDDFILYQDKIDKIITSLTYSKDLYNSGNGTINKDNCKKVISEFNNSKDTHKYKSPNANNDRYTVPNNSIAEKDNKLESILPNKSMTKIIDKDFFVKLNTSLDINPPLDDVIYFSQYLRKDNPSKLDIKNSISNLGIDNDDILLGEGSDKSKWIFILSAPKTKKVLDNQNINEKEKELLDNILKVFNKTIDDVYITPLIKHTTYNYKDPDKKDIEKNFPILALEIAFLKPERIFLMGRQVSQTILSSKAPLSEIIDSNFKLQLGKVNYPLTIIPSFDYFLEIPVEKYLLWQCIKFLK